jgi:hypothetical protein
MAERTSTKSDAALRQEVTRLRARVRELEGDNRRRRRTRSRFSDETEDLLDELPSEAAEEADRLGRAITYAVAESVRSAADVINVLADGIFGEGRERRRSRRSREERDAEPAGADADDVVYGVASGVREALSGPGRTLRTFTDAYERPRTARRTRSSAKRPPATEEPAPSTSE